MAHGHREMDRSASCGWATTSRVEIRALSDVDRQHAKKRNRFGTGAKFFQSIEFLRGNLRTGSAVKLHLGGFTALTLKPPCTADVRSKAREKKWRERRGSNP